ncbi:DUF4240 domain-containing protein [Streptomyces caatingaensis]|uniref:DUF4240 domain-containing protein n=1 Tax=Streptomyces caatingaensis TaxID=1678637 RepID=A0A0K9X897_9ACTN|nr:DUF4240 domain-containing protein [Streptomyces caatingaensis]KNB49311.1 hypothetical protein AC230_28970 [Streptomyces caatingaensis]
MDIDEFWNTIGNARANSTVDSPFAQVLTDHLAMQSAHFILGFQERFEEVHAALYRWDLWAAAYLIGDGCSDDGFIDFRAGLIALGRHWCEKAAVCPDSLAGHPLVSEAANGLSGEALFSEAVNYAAAHAFERVTSGTEDLYQAMERHRDTQAIPGTGGGIDMGEHFHFDDTQEMCRRLPRLAALFL